MDFRGFVRGVGGDREALFGFGLLAASTRTISIERMDDEACVGGSRQPRWKAYTIFSIFL